MASRWIKEMGMENTIQLSNIDDILHGASRSELVELLDLTSNWSSPEDCKFYLYQPNDIPLMFHASPAKSRFFGGGNRSSKTYSHIVDVACQFTGKEPKSLKGIIPKHRLDQSRRIRFCMEDYPNSFTKVVWPYIQKLIPSDEISDVVKDAGRIRSITNGKGGFIEFMYYDQEVTKHQGTSRHSVNYDEEPPPAIRDEGLMRLVDTDGEEVFSLTPLSGALRYLYDDVFDKRGREAEKIYDLVENEKGEIIDAIPGSIVDKIIPGGDPDVHVFFACIFDNKAIKKEAAIRILNKFDTEERVVRSKGHFMFLSGLVYKQYSDTTHLIDTFDNWKKSPDSYDYTLYLAIDPHPRTPHACLFMVALRDDPALISVDELFLDCGADDLAKAIKVKCWPKLPEVVIIDPLAFSPDPISKSCFAWALMDAFDREGIDSPLVAASKDRANGIMAVKDALKPNERGIPRIYVTNNCVNFRREITHWAWDDWRKDTLAVKGEKQKPIDKNDHMMENLYRLVLLNPTFKERHREPREYQEIPKRPQRPSEVGRSVTTGY